MHELAVTESILEVATRHAREAGGLRVTDLYLVIGQLSSVVDDSVRFYWDFVSRGTIAEGARLHFERVPASLRCRSCGHAYGIGGDDLACPRCGSGEIRVEAGEDFRLEAIDVSDESNDRPAHAARTRSTS